MNKNKLIFAIIWIIILLLLIFIILNLNKNNNNRNNTNNSWVFKIWMVWDSVDWTDKIIENFKKEYPKYKSQEIKIESFASFDDYYYTLSSAIMSDNAPDIFVLNNNEKNPIFSSQIIWLDSQIINPNEFRKKYAWVFADDLIVSSWEWTEKEEFLAWIPVWYETLWIFFNRRYINTDELSSITSLNNKIWELKKSKPEIIPIWIWNGSTVQYSSDIFTQFLMLEDGVESINDATWNKLKSWLLAYTLYWDEKWDNAYNSKFESLKNSSQTSVDLFSKSEIFMIVWYPRLINTIKEKWFGRNFLDATFFPYYHSGKWKTLLNYNFFVINKDSIKQDLANNFLWYLSTEKWAWEYLKNYKYYLPAMLSLESDKLSEKIHDDYNILLSDFYSSENELLSFDKWIKNIYDKNIISILDNISSYDRNYEKDFEKFRLSILCKTKKITTLDDISTNCD